MATTGRLRSCLSCRTREQVVCLATSLGALGAAQGCFQVADRESRSHEANGRHEDFGLLFAVEERVVVEQRKTLAVPGKLAEVRIIKGGVRNLNGAVDRRDRVR